MLWSATSAGAMGAHLAEDAEHRILAGFAGRLHPRPTLVRDLVEAGHPLQSENPADLVLAAFRQWGSDCLEHLDGAFALAVFDRRERRLFLARDPTGQVPLFVHEADGRIAFGTALQPLVAAAAVPRVLDPAAAAAYFRYGFVPSPASGVRGVTQLEPGEVSLREPSGPRRQVQSLDFGPTASDEGEEPWAAIRRELEARIVPGRRPVLLDADVPSQVLVALSTPPASTASIWTPEDHPVCRIANLQGTRHRRVAFGADELRRVVVGCLPSADPTWPQRAALVRSLEQDVLSSTGASAVFGLDPRIPEALVRESVRARLPSRWVNPMVRVGRRIQALTPPSPLALPLPFGTLEASFLELRAARSIERCLHPDFRRVSPASLLQAGPPRGLQDPAASLQQLGLRHRVADEEGPAWFGIESEVGSAVERPFLGRSLIDLARRLPVRERVDGSQAGSGLRRFAQRLLPGRVEPDSPPVPEVDRWFRTSLREMAEDLLFGQTGGTSGLLDAGHVRRRWYEHQMGLRDHGEVLWTLLVFEVWSQRLFRPAAEGP